MRVRRYWIGYDPTDVERAKNALAAQGAYLDRVLRLETERIAWEKARAQRRLSALEVERDRLRQLSVRGEGANETS